MSLKIKLPALHWQILIALALAVLFGIYFSEYVKYVSWMGTIFLRALQMIIMPLVISSMICGVANIGDAQNLGRIGLKTMLFYVITTVIAILTGLVLVNFFQPGVGADLNLIEKAEIPAASGSLGQILIDIVPENVFAVMSVNRQLLSVILFALLFGFFIIKVSEKPRKQLTDFFNAVFEVMMKITFFIIKFTPLGIFGLVAEKIAPHKDVAALFESLGIYMVVVLLGLFIHAVVFMPLIIRFIGRINPLRHFNAVKTALFTAFSTSSSNATLPLTMESIEVNAGVSNKITSFTLPLGATINMNGTALYECVAVIFIAQAYGIPLSFGQQVIVVATSLLAAIGAAGVPMAGLVMMSIILSAAGLPLEGIGLILAVDRILDMFRTTVNVWGDTCCAVVIAKSEGEKLKV
ncbi:MAG TPA: dicarboxylate/amino acid:cation symporter [Bacteroidales bacterium]|nr:dicarboxylate/amino acid:cation symporter [Bacteroidales bacterium]HOX78473.1 dicarboxylate/amino acid:cation symporter [Bacteroidales bacterium]HPI85575.1 dicarboxylate/amino acid:cation symporter [Bacteroidales bacterium]